MTAAENVGYPLLLARMPVPARNGLACRRPTWRQSQRFEMVAFSSDHPADSQAMLEKSPSHFL
jgi:hypothetical protein